MIKQNDLKLSRLQKILPVLPPTILILSNIFLFSPFTIYQGNLSEFEFALTSIIKHFLYPSLILLSILSVVGIFLAENLHKRYVSVLFVFGILIWLQGNIFVWNYGVFGKADIDWTKVVWGGWIDAIVWIGFLLLATFFYRHFYKIATFASIALVSLEAAFLVFSSFQQPEVWKRGIDYSPPPEGIFEFSSKQNVIHVILDELQTDVFQKIIEEDPEHYNKVFEGFTFFKENAGSFPTTLMSIPAIMGGQIYQNNVPIGLFVDTVYEGKTIPSVLYDNGYEVDLAASMDWYGKSRHTNWYYIPVPYGVSLNDYERKNSAFVMELVVFRSAPHFLKKILFGKQVSLPLLNLGDTESYEALRHFSNKEFLQDLIDNMSIKRNKPVYKFVHLTTTHWPIVMNKNCQYAGEILPYTWENIRIQAKCSLDHFIEFLNKLKSMGLYDSSFIILNADHGYYKVFRSINQMRLRNLDKDLGKDFYNEEDFAQKVCACSPLMAIKPPHSKGHFRISSAQTSLTDIPSTITSVLNLKNEFNGRSAFEIDSNEIRERRFDYYYELNRKADDYFDPIDEYVIKGSIFDRASWQFVSRRLPPGESYSTRKIDLGTNGANRFLRFGWSFREMSPNDEGLTFAWALGKSASILVSLPKTRLQLTANVKSLFEAGQQSVTVKVDGKEVGGWKNTKFAEWEKKSVIIDANENRPSVSTVDFLFSDYLKPNQKENRHLALLFDSIALEDQPK